MAGVDSGAAELAETQRTAAPEIEVTDPEFYDCAYYASMDLRYLNDIHSGRFRAIGKILPMLKNKKILDVGCGGGGLTNIYSKVTDDVLGVDFSAEAIKFARMRYPDLNVEVLSAFSLSERFAPAEFGAVVANDVIEHVYDQDDFLDNCRTILSPDGYLLVGTDLDDTPATRFRVLKLFRDCLLPFGWNGLRFIMLRILEAPRDRLRNYHDNHVRTISQAELLALLERNGFTVEKILVYNLTYGVVRDFVLNLFRWITRLEMRDHQLLLCRKKP
jgi:cyclopropane fatty-acyl-phospholipid synthase-like methyltransferase